MGFQQKVNRQFTTGFPGDIVRDGPMRAKPARITSPTLNADGRSTNRISRAFGYSGEMPALGSGLQTKAADVNLVEVGGTVFYGVLGHPKHYALQGSSQGTLSPSLDLPQDALGEFFDMVTGMVMELFNEGTAVKTTNFGDQVAYLLKTAVAANNPNNLPIGALISLAPGAAAPAGFAIIPNARVQTAVSSGASSPTAQVSTWAPVQLTQ